MFSKSFIQAGLLALSLSLVVGCKSQDSTGQALTECPSSPTALASCMPAPGFISQLFNAIDRVEDGNRCLVTSDPHCPAFVTDLVVTGNFILNPPPGSEAPTRLVAVRAFVPLSDPQAEQCRAAALEVRQNAQPAPSSLVITGSGRVIGDEQSGLIVLLDSVAECRSIRDHN